MILTQSECVIIRQMADADPLDPCFDETLLALGAQLAALNVPEESPMDETPTPHPE